MGPENMECSGQVEMPLRKTYIPKMVQVLSADWRSSGQMAIYMALCCFFRLCCPYSMGGHKAVPEAESHQY